MPSENVGRIVILNGTSSAGKSSMANAFIEGRAARGEFWVGVSVDDYLAKIPSAFVAADRVRPEWEPLPDGMGRYAERGTWFRATGVDTTVPTLGPDAVALLRQFHRNVRAMALAGFDVLIDDVVTTEELWLDWQDVLADMHTTWVAVSCADAEAREEARGDRVPGVARGVRPLVHSFGAHDATIDTTSITPADGARQLWRIINGSDPVNGSLET